MAVDNPIALREQTAETAVEARHRRWTMSLVSSSLLGAVSGLSGMLISFLALVRLIDRTSTLSRLSTWLIIAALPLFTLSAHALDKIRETETEMRRGYCKEHGLKEDC